MVSGRALRHISSLQFNKYKENTIQNQTKKIKKGTRDREMGLLLHYFSYYILSLDSELTSIDKVERRSQKAII